MKNLLFALIAGMFLFGGVSCDKKGSSKPGDVVEKTFMLMSDGKYDELPDYMGKKDGDLTDEEKTKIVSMYSLGAGELAEKDGIKKVEILDEAINEAGDEAIVKFKIIYGNDETEEDETVVILVDNEWKMLFEGM